jgi:hypothetical protein
MQARAMKERLAAKRSCEASPAKQPPLRASAPVQEQQADAAGKGGPRTPVIYLDDSEEVCRQHHHHHHCHVFHVHQIMGLNLLALCVYCLSLLCNMRITPSSLVIVFLC